MNTIKIMFQLSFCLLSLSASAQFGATSAGGQNLMTTDEVTMAYTIGEVANVHTVNSDNSNKIGILQPVEIAPTAVVETVKPALRVYPNPTADYVTVDLERSGNATYTVHNTAGQKVLSGDLLDNTIVLTTLSGGTYTITIHNGTETFVQKIQKFKIR